MTLSSDIEPFQFNCLLSAPFCYSLIETSSVLAVFGPRTHRTSYSTNFLFDWKPSKNTTQRHRQTETDSFGRKIIKQERGKNRKGLVLKSERRNLERNRNRCFEEKQRQRDRETEHWADHGACNRKAHLQPINHNSKLQAKAKSIYNLHFAFRMR